MALDPYYGVGDEGSMDAERAEEMTLVTATIIYVDPLGKGQQIPCGLPLGIVEEFLEAYRQHRRQSRAP